MPTSTELQATNPKADAAILERMATLESLNPEEVHLRLARALSQTVEGLRDAAACVRFLLDRNEDLSYIPSDLLGRLRLIAYGQLLPEVVFQFAGSPRLVGVIGSLPVPDQEAIAHGKKVEVAVRRGDSFDTRMISPLDMTSDQVRQVFARGRIRSVAEQIATLEASPASDPIGASAPRRPSKIEADARTGTLRVGRHEIPVGEALEAVGKMTTVDPDAEGPGGSVAIDADLYEPLKRIASHRGVTLKHLVRLALLRAYFPGDS